MKKYLLLLSGAFLFYLAVPFILPIKKMLVRMTTFYISPQQWINI